MRILHTSDWHIGKLVHGVHMTADQKIVLDQFIDTVKATQPDMIVIAGDLYDRSIPPVEAVSLLSDVLSTLMASGIPIFVISGNHDSAERLGFLAKLQHAHGLYMVTTYEEALKPITLQVKDETAYVYCVPFLEPTVVRTLSNDASIRTHNDVFYHLASRWQEDWPGEGIHVAVAHGFMGKDATVSESERPLAIGGEEIVDISHFDGFDYVALGHLHAPQRAGKEHIRYSGSLMKYSFSEATQAKGLVVYDTHSKTPTWYPLKPIRDMRVLEGALDDLIALGRTDDPGHQDYLLVRLTDRGELHEPMARLRDVYPNVLRMERVKKSFDTQAKEWLSEHLTKQDPLTLFQSFYDHVEAEEIEDDLKPKLKSLVSKWLEEGGYDETH